MYLGAIVALYISVVSILTLLFEVINQLFPKPFEYVDPYAGGVSIAISMLIVAFPLYLLFMRITSASERENPEKRNLGVRKWLVYLTLFIAGLVMAIDLIILLQTFFAGEEITTAFLLKVLSIICVMTTVFAYYGYDVRSALGVAENIRKRFTYGVSLFVIFAIVFGFFVMGSPYEQKEKRFDANRVSHLQMIQGQIVSYWQSKHVLPEALTDLNDPISGFVLPMDPSTQALYEYKRNNELSFELCAVFSRETPEGTVNENFTRPVSVYKDPSNENWKHGVGRTCFTRTIDPELYPPFDSSVKLNRS